MDSLLVIRIFAYGCALIGTILACMAIAYIHGYEEGYSDGYRDQKNNLMDKFQQIRERHP